MLEYHWLFSLFLRSATCFTQAQGEVDSAPTYLPTIFSFPLTILYLNENRLSHIDFIFYASGVDHSMKKKIL